MTGRGGGGCHGKGKGERKGRLGGGRALRRGHTASSRFEEGAAVPVE